MSAQRGTAGGRPHVVLAHVGADRLWVEWLAEQLDDGGARPEPLLLAPESTDDLATRLRDAAGPAGNLLLVFSEALLRAGGRSAPAWAEPVVALRAELPGRLRMVSVGARRPAFLGADECPVLGDLDESDARAEVLALYGLTAPAARGTARTPWPLREPRYWRQPFPSRNRHFTGREDALGELRERLSADVAPLVPTAVLGTAGVGKTQLVIEYAYRFAACYDLVWYVRSQQLATARADLAGLAAAIGLRISDDLGVTADAVLDALRRGEPARNWLLIFDNAPSPGDLARLLPSGRAPRGLCHVLVTSRDEGWRASAEVLELDVYRRAESVDFLRRRAPRLTEHDAVEVADRFGDLPLALDATAGYLSMSHLPVRDYLAESEQRMTGLLSQAEVSAYGQQVVMAWVLPMNQLRERRRSAAQLLRLCAFLGPEPIPMSLLLGPPGGARPAVPLPEPLSTEITDTVSRARIFSEIGAYGLAKVGERDGRESVQLHRVFQQFLREQLTDAERTTWVETARRLLAAADPGQPDQIAHRDRYADLLVHAEAADAASAADDAAVRSLVINLCRYLFSRGEYTAGRRLGQRARTAWHGLLGPSHPDVVALSVTLANTLRSSGDYHQARVLDEENLARARADLGPAHPETLGAANGLAADLRRLGDWRAAYELDREAHGLALEALGPDHPRTLLTGHNLAVSHRMLGEFPAALDLDEEILRRYRVRFGGQENRSTLFSANNVTRDLRECGEYARACEMQEEVYQRYVVFLGADHPDSLRAMKNLAVSRRKAGRYLDAYQLARDCLARHRRRFGPDYPETLAAATNLANDLRCLEETPGARARAEEAVARLRATVGEQHPYTLCASVNLAVCLRLTGEPEEARRLGERTRAGLSTTLGPEHPYTLAGATNLASDLRALGEVRAARELGEEVWRASRATRGATHPYTLAGAVNLADDRRADGDHEGARELLLESIDGYRQRLGPDHPETEAAAAGTRMDCDVEPPPT
ncbi:FxSxx-COOH system tetratricopeptide repeat protein [Micromonospora sp. WMMD980]|uniref:FxSxx-COOH system tetratricopeptide repeat protein n=1 Tax=Micromonospora sp. WMMD980 TaxID=3016088 RepID=UPI002416A07D|nr:FxSxx-COOH system tetratricopeptide repeat protein [Micromonospora sp. WMMD980]MDG4802379.1 FxSxx-COOH system tetratricopeptide repeat protein [Micromonospora sp. WMMD980]